MMSSTKFRTHRGRKKARRRAAWRGAALAVVVGMAVFGAGVLVREPSTRVHKIYVENEGAIPKEVIVDRVRAMLDGWHFYVVPRDSILALSPNSLGEDLRTGFPRIESVAVQRAGVRDLSIKITEREPAALWCGDVVPIIAYTFVDEPDINREEIWGTCYQVDSNGYLYAEAPVFTGNVYPRYYSSLEQARPVGQYMLPSNDEFAKFQEFFTSFSSIPGEELVALLIVDERDVELYTKKGIRILALRSEISSGGLLTKLKALFTSESIIPDQLIEYMDVRFGNKVYIKPLEIGEPNEQTLVPNN